MDLSYFFWGSRCLGTHLPKGVYMEVPEILIGSFKNVYNIYYPIECNKDPQNVVKIDPSY